MTKETIEETAIRNTINNNVPSIEWGFNDELKKNNNIDIILQNIILLLLCWSLIGIIISIYMKKNKILSILLGPLILYK
jgi:hypothetical protein|tara:strand:- start:1444 stop:1680 length:237 start_codon:yes stop_codon:yes gene_type:complete